MALRFLPLTLLLLFIVARAAAFGSLRDSDLKKLERELHTATPSCAIEPCGEPLFLSALIARDPKAARAASRVTGLQYFEGSYSGLITVESRQADAAPTSTASKNALFFWYMPPIHPPASDTSTCTAPTIMWLQGGPGAPSTYGMFTEIGPVIVGEDGSLTPRNHTWNEKYGLLTIKQRCQDWTQSMTASGEERVAEKTQG